MSITFPRIDHRTCRIPLLAGLLALLPTAPAVPAPAPASAGDATVTLRPGADPAAALAAPEVVAGYTLRVRLDAGEHRLDGSGTLRWRNPARVPVDELCFHLYLNAFRNSASSWLRRDHAESDGENLETLAPDGWGWSELVSLEAEGSNLLSDLRYAAPDDGNPDDRTLARVPLPRPVAPGETVEVSMAWVAQLPRAVARTGYRGDFHLVAQWFPKLGVVEEDGSWNCHQFHRLSEFFADYGNYDVTITVPRRFTVGATGRRVSESGSDGDETTVRYVQDGVHDFAWTAWPDFVERTGTFRHPELPEVDVTLLLSPETARFESRYRAALYHGLLEFGRWYGAYPYTTLTMVSPPWGAEAAGGMEYPTFITTGSRWLSPLVTQDPEGVTVHEFGHQYFYGLLASDEVQESWLDEGITTYATYRVLEKVYGPETWAFRAWGIPLPFPGVRKFHPVDSSARYFTRPATDPVTRTTWGYLDRTSFRWMTYSKTALTLAQLERLLGAEAMERAMRDFTAEWRFRHPTTGDFVRSLSRSAGRDLTGYFAQTLGSNRLLDYAVSEISTRPRRGPVGVFGGGDERSVITDGEELPGWESEVVVRRLGGVRLPVVTELVFAGDDGRPGERSRVRWDGEESWVRFRVTGPRLLWAEVDPDRQLVLDHDRLNNSRRAEPDRRASRRWTQRVRFWIQNLLETFALLATATTGGGTP